MLPSATRFCARFFSTTPRNNLRVKRLNHVAIAVPDIAKASAFYRDVLGAKVSEAQPQPEHGVYTVFVETPVPGASKVELVHPLGNESPITGFLAKNPAGGIHHLSYEVEDVTAAIKELTAKGIRVLNNKPKIGAHGTPVVFLHPKDCGGVLIELEETPKA